MMNIRKPKLTATLSLVILALICLESHAASFLGFEFPKVQKTAFKLERGQPIKQKDIKLL